MKQFMLWLTDSMTDIFQINDVIKVSNKVYDPEKMQGNAYFVNTTYIRIYLSKWSTLLSVL